MWQLVGLCMLVCVCVLLRSVFMWLLHVRSVYISILGERVSIPAGKYTFGVGELSKSTAKLRGMYDDLLVDLFIYKG